MTVRKTSVVTYHSIKESGVLSARRMEVYEALYQYGPKTGNELFHSMKSVAFLHNANIITRLGELRDMGAVEEVRERKCSVTGQNVIEWDVTGEMPRKLAKNKELTSKEAAKITLDLLTFYKSTFNGYPELEKLRSLWKYCQKKLPARK